MSPPTAPSWAFVPDDLFTEFLSLLPVKSLLRFKCVSKSWKTIISDPNFVKLHLNKSKSHNTHFTLITCHHKTIRGNCPYGSDIEFEIDYSIIPYSISSFLDNPVFTLFADHRYLLNEKDCCHTGGFCNGLICLTGERYLDTSTDYDDQCEYWLRLWNPATREVSEKFGCFTDSPGFNFNFGSDNYTGTFKVFATRYIRDKMTSDVRVLSFGDSVWRNIESFPFVPINLTREVFGHNGVFLNGTLNWVAIRNDIPDTWFNRPKCHNVEQLIIVSLDVGTETYNIYTLPRGFAELPPEEPTVRVLGDCLCFSYYSYNKVDFIIWQMKKFGDEESWTQFLKISMHDLQLDYVIREDRLLYLYMVPLFLSKDGNTLVLHCNREEQAILYNLRDHRVKKSRVSVHKTVIDDETYNQLDWDFAYSFVESLISIC